MVTELIHITFYNSQRLLVEAGIISLKYSVLSICQMFLLLKTLL